MTTQSVQVKLELGHKATTRKKPTPEGFTHDWQMFVRGPEGSNIQHFVDRVVFHLHDSFPKPKRVVKEPPYMINESGYAGFNLPIEIYFKNKEEPKKITFNYDLFLHTPNSPPVNHVRCEKLTFQNPTEEFRKKLIKAGGIGIPGPNELSMASQQSPGDVKCTSSPTVTQTPESSKTFADLFGTPLVKPDNIHKKHKSHTSSKERAAGKNKATTNQSAAVSPPNATSPPSVTINTATPPSTPSKESKVLNTPTKHGREKSGKRPAETSPSSESSKKKRKEPPAMVDDVVRMKERGEKKDRDKREKDRDDKDKKDRERRKEKKSSSKESKGKHKSSRKDIAKSSKTGTHPAPKPSKISNTPPRTSPPILPPVPSDPPAPAVILDFGKALTSKKGRKDDDELSVGDMLNFDESLDMDAILAPYVGACSPASTLSFSSLKETAGGGSSGPLGALLAEMEDEEDPLSPLPTTEMSPPHRVPPPLLDDKPDQSSRPEPTKEIAPPVPETKPAGGKAKRRDRESRKSRSERRTKEASKENKDSSKEATKVKEAIAKDLFREHNSEKDTEADSRLSNLGEPDNDHTDRDVNISAIPASMQTATAPNGESLNVLLEIQRRLMAMTDRDLVQQVVNVIEETGMYKISDATFDFDLCSLDSNTVKKLQVCLEMPVC